MDESDYVYEYYEEEVNGSNNDEKYVEELVERINTRISNTNIGYNAFKYIYDDVKTIDEIGVGDDVLDRIGYNRDVIMSILIDIAKSKIPDTSYAKLIGYVFSDEERKDALEKVGYKARPGRGNISKNDFRYRHYLRDVDEEIKTEYEKLVKRNSREEIAIRAKDKFVKKIRDKLCVQSKCDPGKINIRVGGKCVCFDLYDLAERIETNRATYPGTDRPIVVSDIRKIKTFFPLNMRIRYNIPYHDAMMECNIIPIPNDSRTDTIGVVGRFRDACLGLLDNNDIITIEVRNKESGRMTYLLFDPSIDPDCSYNEAIVPHSVIEYLGYGQYTLRQMGIPTPTEDNEFQVQVDTFEEVTQDEVATSLSGRHIMYEGQTLYTDSGVQLYVSKIKPFIALRKPHAGSEVEVELIIHRI